MRVDPQTTLLLRRGIRRGWTALLRDRTWGTTFASLLGIAFMGQLFLLLLLSVQGIQELLRTQTDLRLEIRREAPDQETQEFFAAARAHSAVERAVYITKERALEEERRRDPGLLRLVEDLKIENPFSDTVAVTLRSLDAYDAFAGFVREPRWQLIVDPSFLSQATTQEKHAHSMLAIARAARSVTASLLMVLAIVLLLTVTALVRGRCLARHEEIVVERLVGARQVSILLPFAVEAGFLLLLAAVVSAVLLGILVTVLPLLVPSLLLDGALGLLTEQVGMLLRRWLPWMLALEILTVPLLALLGAWAGMHRHLRIPRLSLMHR